VADPACDILVDQLYAFVDDALDIQMTLMIRAHLEACPVCLQRYQFVLNMRQLLRQQEAAVEVPRRLEKRLRKPELAGDRKVRWRYPGLRPVFLTAMAVLFLLVPTVLFWRHAAPVDLVPVLLAQHRAILQQTVPLRLHASTPFQVTTWLRHRAPYVGDLPQAARAGFTLVGATILPLPQRQGVYVLYKREAEPMAYIVLPDADLPLPRGKMAVLGRRTFSLYGEEGYTIGFWKARGRRYALIIQGDEQEFLGYAAVCLRPWTKAES
jgi:anti-sigma factor (TIGR02949 family)